MKVHNRSPTEKDLHKNEQCRHTFEITHKRCAPCSGYDTNCERYEKTKGAGDKKTSRVLSRREERRQRGCFYLARG